MYTLAKWTVADYHGMMAAGILDGRRVELIGGEIIAMSPEGPIHRFVNYRGVIYLRSLLGTKAIVMEAHPVTLADSEPEPDIAIVRPSDALYFDHHPYPEDIYWLIEIADTTLNKDLGIKKKIYARAGIREYWVIDLTSQVLHVFRDPRDEDYQSTQVYQSGTLSPLAFGELQISVAFLLGKQTSC